MKKLFSLLFILLPSLLIAQSVGINNDGSQPNSTAILDIKSTSKGLLIPRMTTAERNAIVSPAIGLTVFDTETVSYWMFRGDIYGNWSELQHTYLKTWTETGGHIYNTNNGNVGIGTANPASKLTINGIDPVIGIMNNGLANSFIQAEGVNMRISTSFDNPTGKLVLGTKGNDNLSIDQFGRVSIGTSSSFDAEMKLNGNSSVRFAFMHQDVQKGFLLLNGDDFKMGTYGGNNGNIVFSPKGVDKIWIDENGQLGIGTATPVSALTINGTNPYIEMQNAGVNKGFLMVNGNDLRIGTNSTNTTGNLVLQTKLIDRMTIDETGRIGIGTASPSSILTINATDPILQLKNDDADKGFVQLVDSDIKIGTNSSNTYGKFFVRTSGSDRLVVNYDGNVGIGTSFPYQTLSLDDSNPELGFNVSSSLYASIRTNSYTGDFEIKKTIAGDGKIWINANNGSGWGIHLTENGYFHYGSGLTPSGYPFSSQGRMLAPDFVALAVANWPDYVFADTYKLKPLSEVKKFIEENKHLPGIPSAAQIEKEGIQLGDMSKRLMEKIEELTLYIFQQQEQLEDLKKQVQAKAEK
ncbi:MAG: hypothetical protein HOP10_06055 [Chitinophagaceae bacterium]|nr:hypothetical protein [Chitinophagaceae bacterium]